MKEQKTIIAISIDKQLFEKIENLKWKEQMSRSRFIVEALKNYIERKENERKN